MDPSRFDSLVRTLTTAGSRRRLLRVLSALPLVGTALAAVPEGASAAKGKGRERGTRKHQNTEREPQLTGDEAPSCAKRCRKKANKQARRRCRKRCTPPTPACTTSSDCPAGELCESGVCISISDQCAVDTDCDACERCESGVCVAQCAPDQVCRGNQCETVQCTADADCGDCARCQNGRCRWQCTATEVCLSGAGGTGRCCQPRGCPAGTNCGTVDDGCGGQAWCGTCGSGQTCDATTGQCQGPPCRTHLQSCTATAQCCSTDHTACAYNNVILEQNVCCSTLGGTCATGGPSGDCCGVDVPSGSDYAYCSPGGACGGQGAVCRFNEACVTGACCKASPGDDSGVCSGPDGCCRALRVACTSVSQCCASTNTACAYNNVILEENVCCSTLGGACAAGGPSGDCCGVDVPSGSDYAYCSPSGACGGQGAVCRFNEACVTGVCCKASPGDDSGVCSGAGGC